jgi:glycosyltransferase involved in cell wall biosynthesis
MVAMVDLGAQGRTTLGESARRRIVSDFDIEAVARRYGDLYRELTGARPL